MRLCCTMHVLFCLMQVEYVKHWRLKVCARDDGIVNNAVLQFLQPILLASLILNHLLLMNPFIPCTGSKFKKGCGMSSKKGRPHVVFTKAQVQSLIFFFNCQQYPSVDEQRQLGKLLGLTRTQVKVGFRIGDTGPW